MSEPVSTTVVQQACIAHFRADESHMPALHDQVEWDTNPSFNSMGNKPLSYDADLGTSPEVTEIDDDGSGRYSRVHMYMCIGAIHSHTGQQNVLPFKRGAASLSPNISRWRIS